MPGGVQILRPGSAPPFRAWPVSSSGPWVPARAFPQSPGDLIVLMARSPEPVSAQMIPLAQRMPSAGVPRAQLTPADPPASPPPLPSRCSIRHPGSPLDLAARLTSLTPLLDIRSHFLQTHPRAGTGSSYKKKKKCWNSVGNCLSEIPRTPITTLSDPALASTLVHMLVQQVRSPNSALARIPGFFSPVNYPTFKRSHMKISLIPYLPTLFVP